MAFRLTIENLEDGDIIRDEEIKGIVCGYLTDEGFHSLTLLHNVDLLELARVLAANEKAVECAVEDEDTEALALAVGLVKLEIRMNENEEE